MATTLALHGGFSIQTTSYKGENGYAAKAVIKWHEGNVTRAMHLSPFPPDSGASTEEEAYAVALGHAKAVIDSGEAAALKPRRVSQPQP